MAKILICGADGQVGRELTSRGGDEVRPCGRTELDITNAAAVAQFVAREQPAAVINAAAYTAVDRAESEPTQAFAVNADGPGNLAQACHTSGAALLHLSTDYVFDGRKPEPYDETDPAAPQGAYARSKWQGEERVRAACHRHIVLRVSWVFGGHGNNFVKTMLRLAREGKPLRVVADQHGAPTHAGAIADALLALARRIRAGEELRWGTYHYSGTPATTWHGFAGAIFDEAVALGRLEQPVALSAIRTADYPTPARRPANSRFALDKLGALGLQPRPWREGLREVMRQL